MGVILTYVWEDGREVLFHAGDRFAGGLMWLASDEYEEGSDSYEKFMKAHYHGHLEFFDLTDDEKRVFVHVVEQQFYKSIQDTRTKEEIEDPRSGDRRGFIRTTSRMVYLGWLYELLRQTPWFKENML